MTTDLALDMVDTSVVEGMRRRLAEGEHGMSDATVHELCATLAEHTALLSPKYLAGVEQALGPAPDSLSGARDMGRAAVCPGAATAPDAETGGAGDPVLGATRDHLLGADPAKGRSVTVSGTVEPCEDRGKLRPHGVVQGDVYSTTLRGAVVGVCGVDPDSPLEVEAAVGAFHVFWQSSARLGV